jgi:uncharacterized phage-associated protein
MRFHYNARKATQAAAHLVRLNGGCMDLWRMLKLLYLSDKASLVERGTPITADDLASMPFGPTPSRIYDNTKADRNPLGKDPIWKEYLTENQGDNEIRLISADFPTEQLSEFERGIIQRTWEKFGKMPREALSDFVHKLPEYTDPKGSSLPIDPVDILKNADWADDDIDDSNRNAARERYLRIICR